MKVGGGWGIHNDVTVAGDLDGAPTGDVVARDGDGVPWPYPGRGDGTFAGRQRIGGGRQTYTHLIGAGTRTVTGGPIRSASGPGAACGCTAAPATGARRSRAARPRPI